MNDMAGSLYAARSADVPGIDDAFVAALLAGGDSRLAVDRRTGVNKYLCQPRPTPDLILDSSCTASPTSERGFQQAAALHASLVAARSPQERPAALESCARDIEARLL